MITCLLVKNQVLVEKAMKTLHEIIDECLLIYIFIESIKNKVIKERSWIILLRRMHFDNENELEIEIYKNDWFIIRDTIEEKIWKI